MDRIKQADRIMRHFETVGPLTSAEAMYEYGIGRLASRIHEMRAAGIQIGDETVARKNRFGETVHIKQYFLEG